jgi:hypothetical protein
MLFGVSYCLVLAFLADELREKFGVWVWGVGIRV